MKKQKIRAILVLSAALILTGCGAAKAEGSEAAAKAGAATEAAALEEQLLPEEGTASAEESAPEQEKGRTCAEETVTGQAGEQETAEKAAERRREAVKVRGIYVTGPIAGHPKMEELIQLVEDTELNALVIDIKNDEGLVTYKMQTPTVLEIESGAGYIGDIEGLIQTCKDKDIYLIARIVSFKDPYLAEKKPEWSVRTQEGEIFRDKAGLAWVNPYNREVWDYLLEVAAEAARLGFDEIQFDYIRFSTDLKADRLDFGEEAEHIDKTEIITQFTEYAARTLSPLGVYVSADVYGTVIDNPVDTGIVGQDYREMAQNLDYICPMIYPSHYGPGAYGIAVPDAKPYETVLGALNASQRTLTEDGVEAQKQYAVVRPWLQSFTAKWVDGHISYGAKEIREQIAAVYDAGYEEWILWNAAVNYRPDSLLSPEAAEEEEAERLSARDTEAAQRSSEQATGEAETEMTEQ